VPTHAAFLRSVNLGRNRRVTSEQLRECFAGLGFDDVATFRTSGNVVFAAGRERGAKLGGRIEAALLAALGFDVTVLIRTAAQLRAIASHEPFAAKAVAASGGKLQVLMLPRKPAKAARERVEALATADDRLAFDGTELYWLPSGGQMQSALDLAAIEKAVGPTTMRTMGTVEQLAGKFFSS
jgi:uncharacterized protein (DUF1697 family)